MKTTQVEIPLGVQSWGQRPGCEASRASHCPSGQERGCNKIFSAQLSVCCFKISTSWLIDIIRQVCSILKLIEPVESRCRRHRAAWTWWRSWTLARSSGKPRRWESGVLSCSPPCFDILDTMYTGCPEKKCTNRTTSYTGCPKKTHFQIVGIFDMSHVVDVGNLAAYLIFVIFLHRQNFWKIKFTPKFTQ